MNGWNLKITTSTNEKRTIIWTKPPWLWVQHVTLPKFNSSPLKSYRNPIGKDRLPTIIFQGLCSPFLATDTAMDLSGCFVVIAGAGLPAVAALSPKYNNLLWHCLASSFLVKTHQTTLSKILCRRLLKPPSGTLTWNDHCKHNHSWRRPSIGKAMLTSKNAATLIEMYLKLRPLTTVFRKTKETLNIKMFISSWANLRWVAESNRKLGFFSPHNGRGSPKGYCCSVLDLAKTPAASQDLLPAWHTATIALNAPMVSCLQCRCVAWLAILLAGKSCKSGEFFVLCAPRWHGPSSFCVSQRSCCSRLRICHGLWLDFATTTFQTDPLRLYCKGSWRKSYSLSVQRKPKETCLVYILPVLVGSILATCFPLAACL